MKEKSLLLQIAKAGFPVVIFCLCLVLTEFFFRANKNTLNWFFQKNTEIKNLPVQPLTADIVAKIKARFPSSGMDQATFDRILSLRPQLKMKNKGWVVPTIFERKDYKAAEFAEAAIVPGYTIYDVKSHLDENHIRLTGNQVIDPKKKNFLMLGCSFTFGVGVNDDETISSYISQDDGRFNYYNLGVPGGGLSEILDDIYYKDRIKNINKNGGIVVYHFWRDHFRRHFANFSNYISKDRNQYEIVNSELVVSDRFKGTIGRLRFALLSLLDQSEFLRSTGWSYDSKSKENQKKFLDFLALIKNYYKREYNLEFFFSIMLPVDVPSEEFLAGLNERQIKFSIYDEYRPPFSTSQMVYPIDGHFIPAGNYMFSQQILAGLRKNGLL